MGFGIAQRPDREGRRDSPSGDTECRNKQKATTSNQTSRRQSIEGMCCSLGGHELSGGLAVVLLVLVALAGDRRASGLRASRQPAGRQTDSTTFRMNSCQRATPATKQRGTHGWLKSMSAGQKPTCCSRGKHATCNRVSQANAVAESRCGARQRNRTDDSKDKATRRGVHADVP